jgi:hypothetical protein
MSELKNRKAMLIAESEVHREMLKLEIQNLRIYGLKTKQKLMSFKPGNPALAVGVPLLMSLIGRKRGMRRWGALGFLGWKLARNFGGVFKGKSFNSLRAVEEVFEKRT